MIFIFVNIVLFKQKIFVSRYIVYSILNIKFHIDITFYKKTNSKFQTFSFDCMFYKSIFRYFKINKSMNFDLFDFAIFVSMYDLILQKLRYRKNLFENFKQHIVEKVLKYVSLKNYIIKKISKFVALKKFARKF